MSKISLVQVLSGHKGKVWCAAWSPSGKAVATCGEDKTIRIWQEENDGRWVTKTILSDGHSRTIRSVTWSPCGQYLASASFDATVAIWDKKTGQFECNVTLEGHENEVKCVAWSQSGNLLATCSRDKSVWVWEVAGDDEFECSAVLNAHIQDVKKVVWHPTADILASASYDNTIKLYREDASDSDWINTATLAGHTSTVWSLAFDKDGTRLASASDDRTVKIWQAYEPGNEEGVQTVDNEATWKNVCTLAGHHSRSVYDVAWCKQTGLLATACGDDIIRVFQEAEQGSTKNEPLFELAATLHEAHEQDVNSVAWNPISPGVLISTSDDGNAKVWRYEGEGEMM